MAEIPKLYLDYATHAFKTASAKLEKNGTIVPFAFVITQVQNDRLEVSGMYVPFSTEKEKMIKLELIRQFAKNIQAAAVIVVMEAYSFERMIKKGESVEAVLREVEKGSPIRENPLSKEALVLAMRMFNDNCLMMVSEIVRESNLLKVLEPKISIGPDVRLGIIQSWSN